MTESRDPVPWEAILAALGDDPAITAAIDQADAALDTYAEMCGLTLDPVTLRAMLHGLSAAQAVHVLIGSIGPGGDPAAFAGEMVVASGRLMMVLARRLQAAQAP